MSLYEQLKKRNEKISVVGLGYVGLPLAIAFAKYMDVIGFDINKKKIDRYLHGQDPTGEVGNRAICSSTVEFTADESALRQARFHIVAVPTPINSDKTPDLSPVEQASTLVGRNLLPGSIVVYESTVYPGVTEDICVPILERESGLCCGKDFTIGYSPERINPGDKIHRLQTIQKIVSAMDSDTLEEIAQVYGLIIKAGVHRVSNIKTAEAAKVVENSQRDINIAFMNELAMVFGRMGIDTKEVIEAMNTKWNALGFYPGLVGGHCIGVDPYYFVYQAERLGYHSQIVLAGRKINDSMGTFVADAAIKQMVLAEKTVRRAKVAVLGLTFKENCADIRNSRVVDIIERLKEYGIIPFITDPIADSEEVLRDYQIPLTPLEEIQGMDCIIVAVAHREYRSFSKENLDRLFASLPPNQRVLIDVKSIYDKSEMERMGYAYWRL